MSQLTLKNSQEFMELTNWIRQKLPRRYFAGIISSYTINAVMIGFFLFPTLSVMIGWWAALFVASIGTVTIQFFRGLIVFTDMLFAESGENSKYLVKVVALVMTIVGVFELWHLLSGFEGQVSNGQLIGVFVFGSSIIVGGWMMEINFIKQTNKYVYDTARFHEKGLDFQLENRIAYKENHPTLPQGDNSEKKYGNGQNPYKENREVNEPSNSQQKSGINQPENPQQTSYKEIESKELDEFDQKYQRDLELEERLAGNHQEVVQEPIEINMDANFSQNGHHK
jgi:hypothetical protein